MKPEIPFGVRVASSAGLLISSVVSPIDSPIKVNAEEDKCQDFVAKGFTPLQGDCDPSDTIFGIFLVTESGATPDMTQRLAEQGYRNLPPEVANKITIVAEDPPRIGRLGCIFETGVCNGQAKRDEIDRVNNLLRPVGRGIQEPVFLVKSPYDYADRAVALVEQPVPNIYTGSNLFLSNPSNIINQNLLNYVYARAFIHENILHGLGGYDDNDGHGDVGDHYSNTLSISPQHLAGIMEKLNLGIQRYAAPAVEAKLLNSTILTADQVLQPSSLSLVLGVYPSVDTTQFFSEVIPYNNDGAGVSDIVATPLAVHAWGEGGRKVPAPPQWYGLLPDMTYTWRVRTSHLTVPLTKDDRRWGQRETAPGVWISVPGAEITKTFHTPKKFSDKVTGDAVRSEGGGIKFRWQNPDPEVFYYEVQVSKDPTFNTDPQTATAAVYHNLVHGGITSNTWELPATLKESGVTYHARARPRVQGDGTPVAWSQSWEFDPNKTIKTTEMTADQRYSFLKDNSTPDFVLLGEGYETHVLNPQKARYNLVIGNLADRRKQTGISRAKRIKPAA